MNLQRYFLKVMRSPFSKFNPTQITMSGHTISVVIHRDGQFQTELFLVPFQVEKIEYHNHPNVDSYEMSLAGDFVLENNGQIYKSKILDGPLSERPVVKLLHNHIHGADVNKGAAILSFQHWLNGVKPTSVAVDYKIDLTHPSLLSGKKGLDQKTLEIYKDKVLTYGE
jgi:hypothetical protein